MLNRRSDLRLSPGSVSSTLEEGVRRRICVYDCRNDREVKSESLEATGVDFNEFLQDLQKTFSIDPHETFVLAATDRTVLDFNKFEELQDGSTLHLLKQEDQALPAATQERIDFTPHYNTLIESGKHEYSTCEGKKPFSYALAELIDNALSATVKNDGARSIEIRMLLDETLGKPAVIVLDNGCGMSPEDLNDWAKYRLCKFKRKKTTAGEAYVRPDPVPRSLNSDISYFGVGGKHSVFYIGESARMISKKRGSPDVHELTLSKEDFQNKEKNKEDVFSTVITNRRPGDSSHVTKDDERFLKALIREERTRESFTAVIITEVQPEHIDFMKDKFKVLTRQLAHIYHYYIHGLNGNSMRSSSSNQDNSPMVDIQVTLREKPPRLPSVMNLREVEDDMQSLYINSATDTFEFRASTQDNSGKVEGIIRYHPFLYDRETYPQDPDANEDSEDNEVSNDDESGVAHQARPKRSIFDFFWNGRLIPKTGSFEFDWCTPKGSKVPAECYSRFSGALFTNDAFKVTTNKLSFVDLELTLKNKDIIFTRVENGKNRRKVDIRRDFTDWLQTCHNKHDKQIKFVDYKETITREDMPKKMQQPWETFSSIEWDGRIYKTGQLVKSLKTRSNLYGTILRFLLYGKTEKTNGSVFATGGQVELVLEPKALHDKNKIISISKIDKTATEEAILKHIESDSAKLPDKLRVEWPEGNPWKQNTGYPAGTQLGPLKVEILDKNGVSMARMPKGEQGPGKTLVIQLKIVREDSDDDVTFVARYSLKWAFWFKKNAGLTVLGKYTLTLSSMIQENNKTVIGDKELPSYKLSFSITEGIAQKFVIGASMSPTIHVGVPFDIPLQIKDAYDHSTRPPPDLKPVLKCSELELSFEKTDTRGSTFTIKGVRARGKVQDYQQIKTYDLNVTLPGLKEDTQMIKISPLPGKPHSLHVKPEDEPVTVENGDTVKFNVEVHDEAGNITAYPKQIVQCKVDGLPFKAIDCSSTGAGQLETEPINLKIIHGEPQMLKAEFQIPNKKNIATVVRELKVVPSRRVLRMELGSVDDENLVLKNYEKIEWLAGSSLENLFFKLFDEAGREVSLSPEIASKIKVTWTADENLEDLLQGRLPDLQVPTQAHREQRYQVSYQDQSVSFSFYITPHPDEPSKMKVTLPTKNPVKLGETMSGITLELLDQYDNVTPTLTPTCVDHMKVEAEGLDQSAINFVFEESSSSVLVTGVRFQSGSLGARELCFTYMSFEVRVIVKMTNGDPAKLELVSGPEMPLQLFNDNGIATPFVIQLYDEWGNPCPDQRVSVELRSSPPALKVMSPVASMPVNAKGTVSFTVNRVSGPKGYYQLEFMGFFNKKPIPGPSVNLIVIPDPHKPVRLSVQYDTAAKFTAGGKFTAFAVTVESEDGSQMTTFNPAAASMLLWKGASSGGIPPQTATELKCSKPMENENKDCFHFRDKDIPQPIGEYTIQFSLRLGREKVLYSPEMKIKVEANQPVKLGPKAQPTPPVVSYSKDISSRTLVQNLTLFVMDSYGNPAGQNLNGEVLVSIRDSQNAERRRNLPRFDGKASRCVISLVDGKAHIDRLTIMENSPGYNGNSYTLLFEPDVQSVPLTPFTLPFHFFNDAENQRKMSELSKKTVDLNKAIDVYKTIFTKYDTLLPMLNDQWLDTCKKEAEQRKKLINSRVISAQHVTLQSIGRLIVEKNKEVERIFNTPRRVYPHRDQFKELPDVLGMVGHLAFISDDSEARVISWHLRGDMRCVVTKTREAAQRIYHNTQGQQEVLPLTSVYVAQVNGPLPHLRNGRLLFEPRGNPVFARDLLKYPSDQHHQSCATVFKNFLANTILIDDLDSGNHYREMVVQGGSQCPTILTRQGDRISGRGKFGGSQNSAPSNLPDVFGAPLPQEYFTLKEQIELLRQYWIVVQKRDKAEKDFQDQSNKQKSPEVLKQKQDMDEKIKELDEINRQIESSRLGPVKRPGAGEPSGIHTKRGKPAS
ncbi:structural maintenance of chromosomes flexible hinge domain-containing protein 1 [Labrus mixtus]|uniref:structural maintenance of chromosomes flexible hinge domain-containing protein 1 n=1 Tax=Labrus mixtus TaxID=508554 RepID=UPI0029C0E45D|nr:structural maintenance of chromosomes flexible hinge domain-containing protein 1 [Labrus mixtus]